MKNCEIALNSLKKTLVYVSFPNQYDFEIPTLDNPRVERSDTLSPGAISAQLLKRFITLPTG